MAIRNRLKGIEAALIVALTAVKDQIGVIKCDYNMTLPEIGQPFVQVDCKRGLCAISAALLGKVRVDLDDDGDNLSAQFAHYYGCTENQADLIIEGFDNCPNGDRPEYWRLGRQFVPQDA